MKTILIFLILAILSFSASSSQNVKEVNLLEKKGFKFNGLGPLFVRFDTPRARVVQINSISASVTLIDDKTGKVKNIPVKKRVPQFLKEESFAIDDMSGNVYSIADHSINIVSPDTGSSLNVGTGSQFEMVAVDTDSKNCLLVGKTSKNALYINISNKKKKFIPVFDRKEEFSNLNQTPPPPVRKVVFDPALKKFIIFDGITNRLISIDSKRLKIVSTRKLNIKSGSRIHFAGYDKDIHFMYIVTETSKRKDIEAVRIDCEGNNDRLISLPGLTEAVGVKLNKIEEQVYIPYDNHPAVHIADFKTGKLSRVELPSFGNDASAFDLKSKKLFIASWAYGEICVVDLKRMVVEKRVKNMGILPHMFSIAYSPFSKKLYIPLGATAVNGCYGSALTTLETDTFDRNKIYTGWGPVGIVYSNKRGSAVIFNSEDEIMEVSMKGKIEGYERLPVLYPADVTRSKNGNVYFSYGAHQSYWPVVYIWGANNGICEVETEKMQFFYRRTARLAQKIQLDESGGLWATQNSWGKENIFFSFFPKGIRIYSPQERVYFYEMIERENSPRILKYDEKKNEMLFVKSAERDNGRGKLLIFKAKDRKLIDKKDTGPFPSDLEFDKEKIVVSCYLSDRIYMYNRKTSEINSTGSCKGPLDIAKFNGDFFVIGNGDNRIMRLGRSGKKFFKIPFTGRPDRIVSGENRLYIVSHSESKMICCSFDPDSSGFMKLLEFKYPYGDTGFDSANCAFYQKGQFADSIYRISELEKTAGNNFVLSDFLSGRVFIFSGK